MILREATVEDWPVIADFFLTTPLESETSFVLDRRPDFGALPRLRGTFRTFLAYRNGRLAGTVTALCRTARDGERQLIVGELIDFRVAPWARGGRAAFLLLRAANQAFRAGKVNWIVCLIGDQNRATIPLVTHRAGLPLLAPLGSFASVHFIVWRGPRFSSWAGVTVRRATAADSAVVQELSSEAIIAERFAPVDQLRWPDISGRHHAWIAARADGSPAGLLLVWDSEPARRLRIFRYRAADLPLRCAARIGAWLGLVTPLPAAGGVLGMWASCALVVRREDPKILHALIRTALRDAADAGKSVLQLNVHAGDPLLRHLPRYPRSTYRSTLYGCPVGDCSDSSLPFTGFYHADLARV